MKKLLAAIAIATSALFAPAAHASAPDPSQQFLSVCGQEAGCTQFISGFMGMQHVAMVEINRFMVSAGQPPVRWTRWCVANGMEAEPRLVLSAVLRHVKQNAEAVNQIVTTPGVPDYQKATVILVQAMTEQFACPRATY